MFKGNLTQILAFFNIGYHVPKAHGAQKIAYLSFFLREVNSLVFNYYNYFCNR